jgi:CPA2 family monovalent cation:H+ antiporter-2
MPLSYAAAASCKRQPLPALGARRPTAYLSVRAHRWTDYTFDQPSRRHFRNACPFSAPSKLGRHILNQESLAHLVADLLIILAAGLAAGIVCRRLGVSLMVGYMIAGTLIGGGVLGLVGHGSKALEGVATAGALLLLFSIGIEFSLSELQRLGQKFFIAGSVQMLLSAAPVTAIVMAFGMKWQTALLIGCASALSSTVLVFRGLAELGLLEAPAGRRAVSILLFQDIALAPLVLFAPLLSGQGEPPAAADFLELAGKAGLFVVTFIAVNWLLKRWAIQLIAELRSTELVCLFAIVMLGGACITAAALGLPAALGALAAGVAFSGTRLSVQIDSILLPFRETFAAVFFVTLGALLHPWVFLDEPGLMTLGLAGMILVKAAAGAVALRLAGVSWQNALGMGLGLAQLGEFSFLLLLEGWRGGVISEQDYNRTLFIALGTLVVTPLLLRYGSRLLRAQDRRQSTVKLGPEAEGADRVLVVGAGPIGRDVAAFLETSGWQVTMIDLSPVNLQPFAQQGFGTIAGDAREQETLRRASIDRMRLAILCLPNDEITTQTTTAIRLANPRCPVIARVRYLLNIVAARKAGAAQVICEEAEGARAILTSVQRMVAPPAL